ncbi:MAG: hypothetical protein AAGF24_01640 [Cyanobacteria bacterium P01_H01_bin.121]
MTIRQLSFLSPDSNLEPTQPSDSTANPADSTQAAADSRATVDPLTPQKTPVSVSAPTAAAQTIIYAYPDDVTPPAGEHPLASDMIVASLGAHFSYKIIGPCCRLFDREELPWPCCRLQWRGKEPSWRRIGPRFVPDMSVKNAPSYAVEIVEPGYVGEPVVMTMYASKLSTELKRWWYARRRAQQI